MEKRNTKLTAIMERELLQAIAPLIEMGLDEDIRSGDLTTNLIISADKQTEAYMIAKADGVIAGIPIAEYIFRHLDADIDWNPHVKDGDFVKKGDLILTMKGNYRAILTGERLALNFLQRMSGVATETSKYVLAAQDHNTKILDTRKTIPGHRLLDKYAVKAGGGTNHRMGLWDMVMIKDNHISVAGSITNAVQAIRPNIDASIKIEVETTTLKEVKEALEVGADIIMLDNMSNEAMAEAVTFINGRAEVEASGNMTLDRIPGVAATGVDFISIGALTHSVQALDISQKIKE